MSIELPRPLGPFLLLRHLASGGMGDVYLAHQKLGEGERLCVVKTVRGSFGADDTLLLRFLDEARTTSFLTHRNIASVIDVGRAEGTAYMAVEHVAGRDLQSVLRKAKRQGVRIPEEAALYIISELLDALSFVHQARHPRSLEPLKIVHRDISPHNVMVSFAGEVKLIDFGIARSTVKRELTQAGQAIGKVRYMSPEQARAEPVDAATDVWAASIVATELLSGRMFWGDKPLEAIFVHVASGTKPRPPALLELPKPLRHALKKGLAVDRAQRPTAQELKESVLAASTTRGSSEALRQLLTDLFGGEEEEERRAHALLLQEPTSFHAAALWARTAVEDTPVKGTFAFDADAVTASQIVGVHMVDDDESADDDAVQTIEQPVRRMRALQKPVSIPTTTVTHSAPAPIPRRRAFTPIATVAAAVLATCTVTAAAIVALRPPAVVARPAPYVPAVPPDAAGPTGVDTPGVVPAGTPNPDATAPDGTAPDATAPDATALAASSDGGTGGMPLADAGSATPAPVEHVRHHVHHARPAPDNPPHPHERPVLFGDRVRALRACRPAPTCAGSVLRRAAQLSTMSAEELKALDGDVDWCLDQCP